ncbi:MAG: tryptophan--tRNA ligase [Patescibacteria group bacterium]|jgi:tryptophanyl-tRNA synthetase
MSKPRIISGIQPTGKLHLGNYLGALKNFVDLQDSGKYDCFFFIADLHSLTENFDPKQKTQDILEVAATFLALGLNPKLSTIFLQSAIPAHSQLAWIFNTLTPMGELERMTQYKDKAARQKENVNVGLFTYPVLQVADILLYKPFGVPVGQDQVQHVELTRTLARKFNTRFGETFPEPKVILTPTPKVMSLLEPTKKMSKSLGDQHVINLSDEPETITKKLARAVTATKGGEANPGVENLLTILDQFDATATKHFKREEAAGTIRYSDLKSELAGVLDRTFGHFREERTALLAQPKKLVATLAKGNAQAAKVAEQTLQEVMRQVGLQP